MSNLDPALEAKMMNDQFQGRKAMIADLEAKIAAIKDEQENGGDQDEKTLKKLHQFTTTREKLIRFQEVSAKKLESLLAEVKAQEETSRGDSAADTAHVADASAA